MADVPAESEASATDGDGAVAKTPRGSSQLSKKLTEGAKMEQEGVVTEGAPVKRDRDEEDEAERKRKAADDSIPPAKLPFFLGARADGFELVCSTVSELKKFVDELAESRSRRNRDLGVELLDPLTRIMPEEAYLDKERAALRKRLTESESVVDNDPTSAANTLKKSSRIHERALSEREKSIAALELDLFGAPTKRLLHQER